jgi:hypothetical protein
LHRTFDGLRAQHNYPLRAVCLEKPFAANQLLTAISEAKRVADTDG